MVSFAEILSGSNFSILSYLKDSNNYYAHLKENRKETLCEHTDLVVKYFVRLVKENNLESLINSLIEKDVVEVFTKPNIKLQNIIKVMFVGAVYFHDFGKVNQNFQREKMGNLSFLNVINGIGSEHSILSAYLYISFFEQLILNASFGEEESLYLELITISFVHSIIKHHGELSEALKPSLNETLINQMSNYYDLFNGKFFVERQKVKELLEKIDDYRNYKSDYSDDSAIYILLKLNSSLLTASDYYATNEFMNHMAIDDFGILSEKLNNKIIVNTYKVSYNKVLKKNFNNFHELRFEELNEFSNSNLNILRQKLAVEIITNLRVNIFHKLFYIEAPTGAGKTNLSLLALTEILKNRSDVSKIFYVFPYTTIITQTYKTLCDSLELSYSEITEIHSKAPLKENSSGRNENDANYDTEWRNYIDNLFVNYPFVLLSHVKFFDILTSNKKNVNYLLHRLANSVVIIDELQSYNPFEWDKVNYLLQKYSEVMNITFIVMSATLPKISKLFLCKDISKDNFVYLVKNKKEYFTNSNFRERVKIRLDYLDEGKDLLRLCNIVFQHSEDYYNKHNCVKSIIEFVTKTNAQYFNNHIVETEQLFCDYEIYLITGTILEPRRKEIIAYLKSDEAKHKKILVICTQVIEAGLDIDMDIGFKDKAILDSEEQLAGRINRNASKTGSELFIFNTGDSSKVYKNDLRYRQINDELYKEVINERNYDILYERVFDNINRSNNDPFLANNLSDFIEQIKSLRYAAVKDKFCLIKDNSVSIYVPCEIEKKHFNTAEIKFLLQYNPEFCASKAVDGELVWNIYEGIITNKKDGFSPQTDLKIISAIMSKFTFNVWKNPNTINLLLQRSDDGEVKYGFIKLSKTFYKEIYSYEYGLKRDLETDCNFI